MAVRTGGPAPYAPPGTTLDVITLFRDRGLPTPITKDVLLRASVSDSLTPRVLATLEGLDLTDADGNPTNALIGLRQARSDEFKARLEEVVRAAYADVFQFTDPAKDERTKVEDAFRLYEPAGQRGRMVTLFLGLCAAAGIISEDAPVKKTAPATPGTRPAAKRATSRASEHSVGRRFSVSGGSAPLAQSPPITGVPPLLATALLSLPSPEVGWTKEERTKFYEFFGTVLDFAIPIRAANSVRVTAELIEDEEEPT